MICDYESYIKIGDEQKRRQKIFILWKNWLDQRSKRLELQKFIRQAKIHGAYRLERAEVIDFLQALITNIYYIIQSRSMF